MSNFDFSGAVQSRFFKAFDFGDLIDEHGLSRYFKEFIFNDSPA